MLLVFSLLESHLAAAICEQFLRIHTGWLPTTLTLLDVKAILTKVYGVDGHLATQKLVQVTMGPLAILSVDGATVVAAMGTAAEEVMFRKCTARVFGTK